MTSRKVDALVTIKRSGALGLRYEFDERTWCSIGAHADCDIRIHAEKVAVLHGLVSILEDGPRIYGLDKDFPIEIPDRQISLSDSRFAQLHHGDVFFVGERAFRFESANGPTLPTPAVSKSLSRTSGADNELELTNENIPPVSIEAIPKRKKKSRKSLVITDKGEKIAAGPKRASIIHKSRLSLPASKIVQQLVLDNELNLPVKYSDTQPKSRKSMPVFQSAMGQINVKYGHTDSSNCATNLLGEKRKNEDEVGSSPAPKQPKDVASETPETNTISTSNFYSMPAEIEVETPAVSLAVSATTKPTSLLPKTPPASSAPILSEQKKVPRTPIVAEGSALKTKAPVLAEQKQPARTPIVAEESELTTKPLIAPVQVNSLRPVSTPMKAGTPIKSLSESCKGGTPRRDGRLTPRRPLGVTPRTIGEKTPRMVSKPVEGFSLSSSFPSPFACPRNQGTPAGKSASSTSLQTRMQTDRATEMLEPRRVASFSSTPTRNLGSARRVPTTPTSKRNIAGLTPRRVPLSERPVLSSSKATTPHRTPFVDRSKTASNVATGADQRRNVSALTPRRNIFSLTPRRHAKSEGAPYGTPSRKQLGTPRRVVGDPTALRPSITKPNSGLSRLPPRTPKRMRVESVFTPSLSDDVVSASIVSQEPREVKPVVLTPGMDSLALEKAQHNVPPSRSEDVNEVVNRRTQGAAGKPDPIVATYPVEEDRVLFDSAPLEKPASALSACTKPSLASGSIALNEQRAIKCTSESGTAKPVNIFNAPVADKNVKSTPEEEPSFTPRRSPRMHSSSPHISTAPTLQLPEATTPKSSESKLSSVKRQQKALRTPRQKPPVSKKTSAKAIGANPSTKPTVAKAPAAKTPILTASSAQSVAEYPVSKTPKIGAAKASVEMRRTPTARFPSVESESAKAPNAKASANQVSKTPKIGSANVLVESSAEASTPASKSPAAKQFVQAPSVESSLANLPVVVASTKVPEIATTTHDRRSVSKTLDSASPAEKIEKPSALKTMGSSTVNEIATSKVGLAMTKRKSPKSSGATPVARSSLPKSLPTATLTCASTDLHTSDDADPHAVDPNGSLSKAQAVPELIVPRSLQQCGTTPKCSAPHLPALTPNMSSARKPPRSWSRGSPKQKDQMHSVVKTIAKSTRKRSKSIAFASQIELEKGPHYSPRVLKHIPRTPEAFATPDKKAPEDSSSEQRHVPRGSPGARQRGESEKNCRVMGSPPTSRLAALGTFFFPVFPRVSSSDEKNEISDNQSKSCDSVETSESPGSMQSAESDETGASEDVENLNQGGQESADEFDMDSETDKSNDGSSQAATSTAHTPAPRRSFGQRLSGLFFGTPALDVESPLGKESEDSEKEESGTPIATENGPVEKEKSETPTEEPESQEGSSDSEASSSPSNASESEFLTVREPPVPQEPTSRRKSFLGSAFSAVVAAVASPARGLFSRRASFVAPNASISPSGNISKDKMDDGENPSNSATDDRAVRSDSATMNSDTVFEEVGQKSGEQLRGTTSNLLDRFNAEADGATVAKIVPSQVNDIESALRNSSIHSSSSPKNLDISEDKTYMGIEGADGQIDEDVSKSRSTVDVAVSDTKENEDANSLDVQIATTPKSPISEGVLESVGVIDGNITSGAALSVEEDKEKSGTLCVNLLTPRKNSELRTLTDYNSWKVKELQEYLNGINVETSRNMRKAELVALAQKAESTATTQVPEAAIDDEEKMEEQEHNDMALEKNAKVTSDLATWKIKELNDYLRGIGIPTSRTMRKAELVALVQKAQAVTVGEEKETDLEDSGRHGVAATAGGVKSSEEIRGFLAEKKVLYLRDLLRQFGEDDKGRKAELIATLLAKCLGKVEQIMDAENNDGTIKAEVSTVQEEKDKEDVEPETETSEAESAVPEKYEERKTELKTMTVKKLHVILGKLNLDKLGKKEILVDRILSTEFRNTVFEDREEKSDDEDTEATSAKIPDIKPSGCASTAKKSGKAGLVKDEVVDLQRMTVAQLRKHLRENNYCSFGLKAVLIARAEQMQSGTRRRRKAKDNTLCAQCQEGKSCAGPK